MPKHSPNPPQSATPSFVEIRSEVSEVNLTAGHGLPTLLSLSALCSERRNVPATR